MSPPCDAVSMLDAGEWWWIARLLGSVVLALVALLRARSATRAFRRATAARVAAGIALGAAAAIALSCHPHSEQALWRSDGTAEGTEAIFTFPERMPGVWSGPAVVGEELFFLLDDGDWDDGDSHVELWKSDGTAEGTALVTILPTAVGEGGSHEAVGVGGTFYFVYQELEHGIELWKSDGTAEGTGIVRDLVPGEEGSLPSRLWRVGDRLVFFAGYARTYGFALWSTDGTAEGTVLLEDGTNPRQGSTVVDGQLYFLAHDALWQSDGTPAGTRRIGGLRLTGDALLTGIGADVYVAADGQLFAFDRARWRAGSATPIRLVASLPVFAPRSVVGAGDLVYVHALAGDPDRWDRQRSELWRSDGTARGTFLLPSSGYPTQFGDADLTAVGRRVFFASESPATGMELWKTDGTRESTVLVTETEPGPASGVEEHFGVLRGKLLFTGSRGLWTSDGTASGTVRIEGGYHRSDFAILDDRAYWITWLPPRWHLFPPGAGR